MRLTASVGLVAVAVVAVSCGKVGPPQAPLRPLPVAVSNFSLERARGDVLVLLTVPEANHDGTTPPRVDSVEIYAVTQAVAAPAPTAAELAVPSYRIAKIEVRRAGEKPKVDTDKRPVAGDRASYVDEQPVSATGASPVVRYYAAAGMAGSRRGLVSPVLALPLTVPPSPPEGIALDYTEKEFKLAWTPASASGRFLVEEVSAAGTGAKRLTAQPIEGGVFTAALEFGRERCFTVRTVEASAGVMSLGTPSPPQCATPVDRFAPAAPTAPNAFPGEGAIDVLWTASSSADVAGYIVLRGEGADGTLQPLVSAPIAATQYRDQSVKAGVTYSYQIVAIDRATPPNRSEPSSRAVVTAR